MRDTIPRLWFATGEVADVLGVSRHTVRNMIISTDLRAQRTPGGHHRVSRDELIRFLEKRQGSLELLDEWEKRRKKPPECWKFYARRPYDHQCSTCEVYGRRDIHCFEWGNMKKPSGCKLGETCHDCGYYIRFFKKP